jgi:hypothetical protein
MRRSETGMGEFQPPREDLNAPDLYIPSTIIPFRCFHSLLTSIASIPAMAFVTYILLAALQSGLESRFHPEIFGLVATKAIVVLLLDFLFVKGGCYLLGVQASSPIVDLLAYGGYKFVGCVTHLHDLVVKLSIFSVIATLLIGLIGLSRTLYSVAFIYTFLANAFFLVRTQCARTYPLLIFLRSSAHCALSSYPTPVQPQGSSVPSLMHNDPGVSHSYFLLLSYRSYSWVYWFVYSPRKTFSRIGMHFY